MSMTARRSVPCLSRLSDRLRRLPAMERTIGTMSTVRSASVTRMQRASGYNWRALVEADIGRYKRVIGDALRSRTDGRQTTEVAIAVASLNHMLELGRPEYVRLS